MGNGDGCVDVSFSDVGKIMKMKMEECWLWWSCCSFVMVFLFGDSDG